MPETSEHGSQTLGACRHIHIVHSSGIFKSQTSSPAVIKVVQTHSNNMIGTGTSVKGHLLPAARILRDGIFCIDFFL